MPNFLKRLMGTASEKVTPSRLPVLMRVLAGFSKVDGEVNQADIDSSLAFLRYDYPGELYAELREIYRAALSESIDLNQLAIELASALDNEEKILLGIQLYVLISKVADHRQELIAYYLFMTNLGIASQAIDIVYQLSSGQVGHGPSDIEGVENPLEALSLGPAKPADMVFKQLDEKCLITAFRFQGLILLKNAGLANITARGRVVAPGDFCRLFSGHRLILGEVVITYDDLLFYFNTRRGVAPGSLFLTLNSSGSTILERRTTRQTDLEIKFGLHPEIHALKDTAASLNGTPLLKGVQVTADPQDQLEMEGKAPIPLEQLRNHARDLGAQFELRGGRTVYRVSNEPEHLQEGDILLSSGIGGEILLEVRCDYQHRRGQLTVIRAPSPPRVSGLPVKETTPLSDGARIDLGGGHYLHCDFTDRIIEEQRSIIQTLDVENLSHSFTRQERILDGVSFSIRRGEMICVMGPSGCGKSTLLRTIAGQLKPSAGNIHLNGNDLYEHLAELRPSVSFLPQEESFDPLLTVRENLDVAAALRAPQTPGEERRKRVDSRLSELGLTEMASRRAGTTDEKTLSGGQRKRLNIGLDMIGLADVFLLDEPTSGLSSKDSENVLEIIRGLAQNKIVLVSIHQPSARLFHLFDKAILLDRGGRLAFVGTPDGMLQYFAAAQEEQSLEGEADPPAISQPEEVFDILERPLRDPAGDIIYEMDSQGNPTPARRVTPEVWRDRFQTRRLIAEIAPPRVESAPGELTEQNAGIPEAPRNTVRSEFIRFGALLQRSFLSKARSRGNLATTFLQTPALALLIAIVLRFTEEGTYHFAAAFHIPTYLFLSLVVALFLGLTNSVDEIIRDRPALSRERNCRLRASYYVLSKFLVLGLFALLQVTIFLLIGNALLSIRGGLWLLLGPMWISAMAGVGLGLLVSSLVPDSRTALNLVPLLLIPQIILGGALIKFEEMNRNLNLLRTMRTSSEEVSEGSPTSSVSNLHVPFVCQFMPLRWTYESAVLAIARENPLTKTQNTLAEELRFTAEKVPSDTQESTEGEHLKQTKDALVIAYGLSGTSSRDVSRKLNHLRRSLREGNFSAEDPMWKSEEKESVPAENFYVNEKTQRLVTRAEIEYEDYRREGARADIFLADQKHVRGMTIPTRRLNLVVMLMTILGLGIILNFVLRRQFARAT